jgi:hypothetical protein
VEYDGEEIDGSGGYSTTGKWNENKWILCNGDEVYQSQRRDEMDEDDDEPESACDSEWPEIEEASDLPVTDWYPVEVKPVHKGEYEVDLGKLVAWPFARIVRAEWTGRSWKDSEGNTVKGIESWRGLAVDSPELK